MRPLEREFQNIDLVTLSNGDIFPNQPLTPIALLGNRASSDPNEPTDELEQSSQESVEEQPKKESTWTPLDGRCPGLFMYAQTVRKYVNARFISRPHKVEQDITHSQRNAIHTLKTNHNIVIKPADKGGAIVIQNRTDYCKEVYRQLNNQQHDRQLPADLTKEHTRELNALIRTLDPVLQSSLRTLIPHTSHLGDYYCLPKIHKVNSPANRIRQRDPV
ncbi:uncharacterized protein [Chiloscyllium punctatum]|uniref:uncharacterized protein n=1 Tax=Chiloscyllium punctatum TaxID=137246 RepID=UPI003B635C0C